MAIDIEGIFKGLLQFFELAPTGTRTQFVNALDNQGIATPAESDIWINKFLEIADGMGLIDSADFDVLMTKRQAVGLDKAIKGATAVYYELKQFVDFQIGMLQHQRTLLLAMQAIWELKPDRIAQGRAWLEANAPASAVKDATLEAIDFGSTYTTNVLDALEKSISDLEARIEALGGTV